MCNLLNIHIFIINLLSKYYILDVIYINIIYLIYRQYICIYTCIYTHMYIHIYTYIYEHIYIQYIYIIWIYTYVIYISTNYYI